MSDSSGHALDALLSTGQCNNSIDLSCQEVCVWKVLSIILEDDGFSSLPTPIGRSHISFKVGQMITPLELKFAFETAYSHLSSGEVSVTYAEFSRERFTQNKTALCLLETLRRR